MRMIASASKTQPPHAPPLASCSAAHNRVASGSAVSPRKSSRVVRRASSSSSGRSSPVTGEDRPDDEELARRTTRADLRGDAALPDATRLWAALQDASGGTWGGCVYDVDRIVQLLNVGKNAGKQARA